MKFGEVDSMPQFKSVKDAVSMLNASGFSENKCIMKKSRTCLPEKMMTKMRTYDEVEGEIKLADNITSKVYNSFPSGEFEEESSLENVLEFLKMELTSLKTEHSKLTLEESLTGSIIFGLKAQKLELDACLTEEFAARGQLDGLLKALQEMLLETRDARKEEEDEMRFTINDLKKQTKLPAAIYPNLELRLDLHYKKLKKQDHQKQESSIRSNSCLKKLCRQRIQLQRPSQSQRRNLSILFREYTIQTQLPK